MKTKTLFLLSIVLFLSTNCQDDFQEPIELSPEIEQFIQNVGDRHNEMVLDFFLNVEESLLSSGRLEELTESHVVEYLDQKYGTNLKSSEYYLFSEYNRSENTTARTAGFDFDPYDFLKSQERKLSEYAFKKVNSLLHHSANLNKSEYIKQVIHDFSDGVRSDNHLSEEEKVNLLIILSVYQSSLDLWTYLQEIPVNGARIEKACKAWHIATADFIQGVGGGLLGGPAGALVGLVAGSLTQSIGCTIFENVRPYCNTVVCTSANIPKLEAVRPSSYQGQALTSESSFYNIQ